MRFFIVFFCLLSMLVGPCLVMAQSEAESASRALVFTQIKTGEIDTVVQGDRVEVIVKRRFLAMRGNLDAVKDSSIVVRGREIALADVKQLFIVHRRIHTLGLILAYTGLALLLFAAIGPLIAAAYLRNHPTVPRTGTMDKVAGRYAFRLGLIILLIGDLILIFRGHRYKLISKPKWKVSVQKAAPNNPDQPE